MKMEKKNAGLQCHPLVMQTLPGASSLLKSHVFFPPLSLLFLQQVVADPATLPLLFSQHLKASWPLT